MYPLRSVYSKYLAHFKNWAVILVCLYNLYDLKTVAPSAFIFLKLSIKNITFFIMKKFINFFLL